MKNTILVIAIALVTIAGGYWFFHIESEFARSEVKNQDLNTQLLKIDNLVSSTHELALRSRANLDTNYDVLVRNTVLLERKIGELSNGHFDSDKIAGSLLETRFNNFISSIEVKTDQIESFKSSNAILRNSEAYVPLVGAELGDIAQQIGNSEISNLYRQIVSDVMAYTKQGSLKPIENVIDHANVIIETEEIMPEASRSKVLEFANHVSTAIDAREKTDQYLNKILTSSSGDEVEELFDAWNQLNAQNNDARRTLPYYMAIYVFTILVLVGILVFRLRRLYENLNRTADDKSIEIQKLLDNANRSEDLLAEKENLASLGELTNNLVGNFRLPLNNISSNIDIVKSDVRSFDPIYQKLQNISEALLDPNREKGSVNEMLKDLIVTFRVSAKESNRKNMGLLLEATASNINNLKKLVNKLLVASESNQESTGEENSTGI